jgi:hypothetical protein
MRALACWQQLIFEPGKILLVPLHLGRDHQLELTCPLSRHIGHEIREITKNALDFWSLLLHLLDFPGIDSSELHQRIVDSVHFGTAANDLALYCRNHATEDGQT